MTQHEEMPGARLRRFAERTFDRETVERVLLPAIADLQHECDRGAASWFLRLRAYWGLWKTIALCVARDAGRDARPTVASVAKRMAIIAPIVMGAAMIPVVNLALGDAPAPGPLLIMSLPQSFALALPVAYFFAVLMEPAPHPRRLLPAVMAMSITCSALMLPMMMSIMPRANQAYREAVFTKLRAERSPNEAPAHLSPGPAEWTFTDLVRKSLGPSSDRESRSARRMLSTRFATSTAPIMLGFVGLAISGYSWPIALMNGIWVLMFYVVALRAAGPSSTQAPPSVARFWLVNGIFALVGLVIVLVRRRANDGDPPIRFYLRT
jgi:hypothetical protein